MNTKPDYLKVVLIAYCGCVIGLFMVGWSMEETYSINTGESHLLGLKFIPPCAPYGGDVSCGVDSLFIIGLFVIPIYWLIGGLL